MTLDLHFVTPEAAPLERFGEPVSRELRGLLDLAGITLHTGLAWTPAMLDVQRVVTLPRLEGPAIAGLPHDARRLPRRRRVRPRGARRLRRGRRHRLRGQAGWHRVPAGRRRRLAHRRGRRRAGHARAVRARAQGPAADRALGALPQARQRRARSSPPAASAGRRPRSPAASSPATSRPWSPSPCVDPSPCTRRAPASTRATATTITADAGRCRASTQQGGRDRAPVRAALRLPQPLLGVRRRSTTTRRWSASTSCSSDTDPRLVHFEVDLYWAWYAHRDPVQLLAFARRPHHASSTSRTCSSSTTRRRSPTRARA